MFKLSGMLNFFKRDKKLNPLVKVNPTVNEYVLNDFNTWLSSSWQKNELGESEPFYECFDFICRHKDAFRDYLKFKILENKRKYVTETNAGYIEIESYAINDREKVIELLHSIPPVLYGDRFEIRIINSVKPEIDAQFEPIIKSY